MFELLNGAGSNRPRLAVIDLGSNSFKLRISEGWGADGRKLADDKATVRLIDGINENGIVNPTTSRSALDAASRFAELMQKHGVTSRIAVATQAFRQLAANEPLIEQLERTLGVKIRVVSGTDEAELCWDGVSEMMGQPTTARLVIDLGGGSLQMIYGNTSEVGASVSLPFGCVTWTRNHFPDNTFRHSTFDHAVKEASKKLRSELDRFGFQLGTETVGASGAFRAVVESCTQGDRSTGKLETAMISKFVSKLRSDQTLSEEDFPHVSQDRVAIMPACLCLVSAVFEATGADFVLVTKSGLRRGAELAARKESVNSVLS